MAHGEKGFGIADGIGQVKSRDGTVIGYRRMGTGPAVIVLHGSLMDSQDYLPLARSLATAFTVYIPDRRGRGLSGACTADHGIGDEVEDLGALMEHSGAERIFGHSAGGSIALEAALRLPIRKLAVYEPPIKVDGRLLAPTEWLSEYEQALRAGRHARALSVFLKGMRMNSLSRLPHGVLSLFSRLLFLGEEGKERRRRLPTVMYDMRTAMQLAPHEQYSTIAADVLVLGGLRSPDYLREATNILGDTLPHGRVVTFETMDHTAPVWGAAEAVGFELARFFSSADEAPHWGDGE